MGAGSVGDDIPVITPVFKTPLPDRPFRDEIVVEILPMDGRDFNRTVTPTEARKPVTQIKCIKITGSCGLISRITL